MGRKEELEGHIRDSYELIQQYETVVREMSHPEERKLTGQAIDEQWGFIRAFLDEYLPLNQQIDAAIPDDIRQIVALLGFAKAGCEPIMPDESLTHLKFTSSSDLSVSHLPTKAYRELIGRDALIGDIVAALCDPEGKWIVTIDGMGGIGKTALAREVAKRCLNERLFDAVVWEQASREEFIGVNHREGIGTLSFEMVLDAIGRQLGAFDVLRLKGGEKEARVRALVHSHRTLVVLDNLETARGSQKELARQLRPLLDPSKALLTSRQRFRGDLYAIHLTGLEGDSLLQFIRQEAEEKGISRVVAAETDELQQIAQLAGGSPLALKLVVSLLGYLPFETALEQLRAVRLPEEEATEVDDYRSFYRFIFLPSWQLLSDDGKKLLISMAPFAPGVGGTFEAVKAVSNLPGDVLTRSIEELWQLSFLETGMPSDLKRARYYLHALTQYFVLSDIVGALKFS